MVTRVSPDASDFSIVIEKMSHKNSGCARGNNPVVNIVTEKIVLDLKGKLLTAAKAKGLHVWYSNMASGQAEGVNPPDSQVFQKRATLPVSDDGSVTITVNVEEMYTITTIATGSKGSHPSQSKPNTPFPIPFTQDFDLENVSAPPALWYDQMGAWEVQVDPGKTGNLMRQVSPVWPACWGYSCSGPLTYFGPASFNQSDGMVVEIDVKLEDHGTWHFKGKQGVALSTNGTATIAGAKVANVNFAVNTWHSVQLTYNSTGFSVSLDGTLIGSSSEHSDGFYFEMGLDRYIFAAVDNFKISPLSAK